MFMWGFHQILPRIDKLEHQSSVVASWLGLPAEQEPLNESNTIGWHAQIPKVRLDFVRKVYSLLAVQLACTAAIAAPYQRLNAPWIRSHGWVMVAVVAEIFISLISIICLGGHLRRTYWGYFLMSMFTLGVGSLVGLISAMHTWHSVLLAVAIASSIFVVLTIYAWTTSIDFTGWMPFVMALLGLFMSFGATIMVLRWCFGISIPWMHCLFNGLGVLMFSFYILYDTQRMLGEWGGHEVKFAIDDYMLATLALYIDIVNMFFHMLALMGQRKN